MYPPLNLFVPHWPEWNKDALVNHYSGMTAREGTYLVLLDAFHYKSTFHFGANILTTYVKGIALEALETDSIGESKPSFTKDEENPYFRYEAVNT